MTYEPACIFLVHITRGTPAERASKMLIKTSWLRAPFSPQNICFKYTLVCTRLLPSFSCLLISNFDDVVIETRALMCAFCIDDVCSQHISENDRLYEPRQANLCLRAFRYDKFQLRMSSHSEWPGTWLSVWRFLLTHCLYERAAKVLARLRGCAGSPEPSLLA